VGLEGMASTLMSLCASEAGRGDTQSRHGVGGKGASAGQN
jgi:hypothetical protein